MPDRPQPELEFTGERVIQGLVDQNLFNEHLSRYRFAARYTEGRVVLDAGCGSGYGAAQFTQARRVFAVDFSGDALQYARLHFADRRIDYAQARCEFLPFADASFDVITAFEVIEHLQEWQLLLTECKRVLRPSGLLVVSTPNKAYYAETRAEAGPNPFHHHEFNYAEFRDALREVFPYVEIWAQNHAEAIVFEPSTGGAGSLETSRSGPADEAHFYLAVCGIERTPESKPFAWVPEAANVLRERERHIALLEEEVERKSNWLKQLEKRHAELHGVHESVLEELRRANRWAEESNRQLDDITNSSVDLQEELNEAKGALQERDREIAERMQWIASLQGTIQEHEDSILKWQIEAKRIESELGATHAAYQARTGELEQEQMALHTAYGARIESVERDLRNVRRALVDSQKAIKAVNTSNWHRLGRVLGIATRVHVP